MTFSFKQLVSLFVLASCLLFAASLLQAWTGPTASAPSGNVSAPINVGTTDQVKNAGLSLNALAVFGNAYVQNKLGIATSAPQVALDVAGTLKIGSAGEVCQGVTAGAIRYNSSSNVPQYCDGTSWRGFGGFDSSVTPGSQSYTTGGTYTFTIPTNFNALTAVVRGGGGGGGSGGKTYVGNAAGSAGGTSSFNATVVATGGTGGPATTCNYKASSGSGSGGDVNRSGDGGAGGVGGYGNGCVTPWQAGGEGGDGGLAVKTYTSSSLSPGGSVEVVVGNGGAAGPYYYPGVDGGSGSVEIFWQ